MSSYLENLKYLKNLDVALWKLNSIAYFWFLKELKFFFFFYFFNKFDSIEEFLLCTWSLFLTLWTVARKAPLSMGILKARILEWVAMPSFRGSSQPRDWTQVSHIAGGLFTIWATREAQEYWSG